MFNLKHVTIWLLIVTFVSITAFFVGCSINGTDNQKTQPVTKVSNVDVIKGDINFDGKVNLTDISLLAREASKLSVMDINGDGIIDTVDVKELAEIVYGK